jgi:2-hydroxy-6-oxonona-2,4-dienedioate hydrolase
MQNKWKKKSGTIALAVAALGLAGAGAWHARSKARRRREQLARGELHELEDVWTTVGGRRVYSRVSTVAARRTMTPVVLVHGFGISSSYFVPTAERLAAEFDVYAPDLPGHGRSDNPKEPLDIPQMADALRDWMDATGIPKAMFVANSMGCQVVVDLAVRHPERVDRLVLIGPTIDPRARSVLQHLPRFAMGGLYERQSLTQLLVVDYSRMGWRILPELRFMMDDRIEKKLPHVKAPTMLVRGENDTIVPPRWFEEAARLVRAEQVAVIPGRGHAVHYSAADELVAAVTGFLRRDAPELAPGMSTGMNEPLSDVVADVKARRDR